MSPGNRHATLERRARIDALHRAAEPTGVLSFAEILRHDQRGSGSSRSDRPTLDSCIDRELRRARANGVISTLADRAHRIAEIAKKQEPNIRILAAFAVERALAEMAHGLPFSDASPDGFVDGTAYVSQTDPVTGEVIHRAWDAPAGPEDATTPGAWHGILPDDLTAVRALTVPWERIRSKANFPAIWAPRAPKSVYQADPVRPPVEAMVLAADVINGHLFTDHSGWMLREELLATGAFRRPTVVAVGLGYAAAAQALSARLPLGRVVHRPVPYEWAKVVTGPTSAVVLGVPSLHSMAVAEMLSGHRQLTFLARRAVIEGKKTPPEFVEHVPRLLELGMVNRLAGAPLILVGDTQPHAEAVRLIRAHGLAIPLIHEGVDSGKRGVWVGYLRPQWAPHGLPGPTSKVVSFWLWN